VTVEKRRGEVRSGSGGDGGEERGEGEGEVKEWGGLWGEAGARRENVGGG